MIHGGRTPSKGSVTATAPCSMSLLLRCKSFGPQWLTPAGARVGNREWYVFVDLRRRGRLQPTFLRYGARPGLIRGHRQSHFRASVIARALLLSHTKIRPWPQRVTPKSIDKFDNPIAWGSSYPEVDLPPYQYTKGECTVESYTPLDVLKFAHVEGGAYPRTLRAGSRVWPFKHRV